MTYDDLRSQWGERIRDLRKEKGLSQYALARESGVGQSQIWQAENGNVRMGDETRIKLAAALGVRVEDIFVYPDTRDRVPT